LVPETSMFQKRSVSSACRKYHLGLMFLSRDKGLMEGITLKNKKPYNTYLAWLLNECIVDEV